MAIDNEGLAAIDRLTSMVEGLRGDVQALRRRWRWMAWAAAVAAFLLVLGGLNFRYSVQQASCTSNWVNGFAQRVTVLTGPAQAKNAALDNLIRAVKPTAGESQADAQARFGNALTAYLQASDAYNKTSEANPAPIAPGYVC